VKKISSLFARDSSNPRVLTRDYHPNAAWVVAGEGSATRKWDGTAVRVVDGQLWARYDAKHGKPTPPGFVPSQDPDPNTGHHPGWVLAVRPEDKWLREAAGTEVWPSGTYEACGPRINGNPEKLDVHKLVRHGDVVLPEVPITWDGLLGYFTAHDIEGVVWWRDLNDLDCDKIKITAAAMGLKHRSGKRAS
jgi:hypothetical protein